MKCSAKTGEGVKEVFDQAIGCALAKFKPKKSGGVTGFLKVSQVYCVAIAISLIIYRS